MFSADISVRRSGHASRTPRHNKLHHTSLFTRNFHSYNFCNRRDNREKVWHDLWQHAGSLGQFWWQKVITLVSLWSEIVPRVFTQAVVVNFLTSMEADKSADSWGKIFFFQHCVKIFALVYLRSDTCGIFTRHGKFSALQRHVVALDLR